jgi:hypothetical protein
MPAYDSLCTRRYTWEDCDSRLRIASQHAADRSIAIDAHADSQQPRDSVAHSRLSQVLHRAQQRRPLDALHPRLLDWRSRRVYSRATVHSRKSSI